MLKEDVSRLEKNIRKLSQNEDEIWEQMQQLGAMWEQLPNCDVGAVT